MTAPGVSERMMMDYPVEVAYPGAGPVRNLEDERAGQSKTVVREVVAAALELFAADDGKQPQRLAGHDVTPGHDQLHHYWTKGEGLAKWVKSPHPWTALYHHLVKYVNPEMAKSMASAWFHEVLGFWPGEKHVGAAKVPKGGRSALIRAVVAEELALLRKFDPLQPRDPDGKWSKAGAAKATIEAISPEDMSVVQREMTAGQPWTADQITSMKFYSAHGYSEINGTLRDPERWGHSHAAVWHIQNLDAALRPLPRGVRTQRRVDATAFGSSSQFDADAVKASVGRTLQDPGFLSTTIDMSPRGPGSAGAVLEIEVPAGARAAYVESISDIPEERELILEPGTRLHILSADSRDGDPTVYVKARVIL